MGGDSSSLPNPSMNSVLIKQDNEKQCTLANCRCGLKHIVKKQKMCGECQKNNAFKAIEDTVKYEKISGQLESRIITKSRKELPGSGLQSQYIDNKHSKVSYQSGWSLPIARSLITSHPKPLLTFDIINNPVKMPNPPLPPTSNKVPVINQQIYPPKSSIVKQDPNYNYDNRYQNLPYY